MTTDRQFTGQRRESGLGLYDYNARYYDSYLNRFIQADTIVPSPANPQSLNRYAYTLNNPLKYKDPSGHREVRYSEGDIIDEETINSNVYIEWNPLSKQKRVEIALDTVGILGVPIVAMVAPSYAARGAVSTGGYMLGAGLTGQNINVTEALLAFYVGGFTFEHWSWGGISNEIQYLAACGIRGETPTLNDGIANFAAGTAASKLEPLVDKLAGKLGGEALEGFSKGTSPAIADASSQMIIHGFQMISPQFIEKYQQLAVVQAPQGEETLPSTPWTMP